jgi:hypothetical protein
MDANMRPLAVVGVANLYATLMGGITTARAG